jgi:hypothetical protein
MKRGADRYFNCELKPEMKTTWAKLRADMKKLVVLAIVLIGLCGSVAAQSLNIEIDLARKLKGLKNGEFRTLALDSEDWIYCLSADGLPAYRHVFSLPQGESPSIKSITGIITVTSFNFNIESLLYLDQSTDESEMISGRDHSAAKFEIISGIRTRIEKRFSADGLDYYNLYIIPFSYDADNRKLSCYSKMILEIESEYDTHQCGISMNPRNQMEIVLNELAGANPESGLEPVSPLNPSAGYSTAPDYIIITSSELAESFALFALWKRSLGYNAEIKLIEEIETEQSGLDLAEKVREYLKLAYADGLEWLLIGGDETVVPIRKLYAANTNEAVPIEYIHPSDLYYGDLTGEWDVDGDGVWGEPYHDNPDLQPEIFVGRVPLNTPQEISRWMLKSINYENGGVLSLDDYTNKVLITSADQMRDWNYGLGQDSLVAAHLPGYINPDLTSMAELTSGYDPSPIQPSACSFVQKYSEGWNLAIILAHGTYDGFVTKSSGYNQWPKTFAWATSGEGTSHGYLDNLTNNGSAGIIYSVACSQGAIDSDQPPLNIPNDCVAEYFLKLENRGAAAFIGYSRYGWVASSYRLTEKFVEYLYDNDNRLGPANTYSKLCYTSNRDLNYGLNLYGDPSLKVWTDNPSDLECDHPQIISLGNNLISVRVTSDSQGVEAALVTVVSNQENLFYGYTDADGYIDAAFDTGLDSAVVLTASRAGYRPFQAQLATSIVLDADDDNDERPDVPRNFTLYQNFPNPANPTTTVAFELPQTDDMTFELFNLLGQMVTRITREDISAGYHELELDLTDNPSGVYFYRLTISVGSDVKKLMLLK